MRQFISDVDKEDQFLEENFVNSINNVKDIMETFNQVILIEIQKINHQNLIGKKEDILNDYLSKKRQDIFKMVDFSQTQTNNS